MPDKPKIIDGERPARRPRRVRRDAVRLLRRPARACCVCGSTRIEYGSVICQRTICMERWQSLPTIERLNIRQRYLNGLYTRVTERNDENF